MATLKLKDRFEFDVLASDEDRLFFAMIRFLTTDGHGDIGSCGVAEFSLLNFAEATNRPPGEALRRLKSIAVSVKGLCVEHENVVLFAIAGADQHSFAHLYKSRGFEGLPPNLPRISPRQASV